MASLTIESVHEAIDRVLQQATDKAKSSESSSSSPSISWWRRIAMDWDIMCDMLEISRPRPLPENPPYCLSIPYYFGIQAIDAEGYASAFCSGYLGYSTWDGRMLYVDQCVRLEGKDSNGQTMHSSVQTIQLYQVLAKIAVELGCVRLSWKEKKEPSWNPTHPPEFLKEWWFLEMDPPAMTKFVAASGINLDAAGQGKHKREQQQLSRSLVERVVKDCIQQKAAVVKDPPSVTFRLAGPNDMETVRHLVQQLAIYEKEPGGVNVTANDYQLDGGSEEPIFYCILADVRDDKTNTTKTIGMGFFFFAYDVLGEGRFLYLDDLFVEEEHRGKGAGKGIMELLAHIALSMECCKFVWTALDWNFPALQFYEKIGAKQKTDLKITRYCGQALKSFANQQL